MLQVLTIIRVWSNFMEIKIDERNMSNEIYKLKFIIYVLIKIYQKLNILL